MTPNYCRYILLTIDTEEDMPQWKPEPVTTCKNIQRLPKLHEALKNIGIPPTYLVDKAVLDNEPARSVIEQLHLDGHCEIGMHLHSWNSPPILNDEASGKATVLTNLPPEVQREKIYRLYDYFSERLQLAPTSYRAGRYGLSTESMEVLSELGFEIDSSIVPYHDFSQYGAPNYRSFGREPFWIRTASSKDILEVPITADIVARFGVVTPDLYYAIPLWTHLRGLMHRLNIAQLLWLRPTTYAFEEMRDLAYHIIANEDCPIFNVMFHSSELFPSASPYNATESDVDQFIDRLMQILNHLMKNLSGMAVTLTQMAKLARQGQTPAWQTRSLQL